MSPSEVVAAFPGEAQLDTRDAAGSPTVSAKIPEYEVAGRKYHVQFNFEGDGLAKVILVPNDLANLNVYDDVFKLLAEKYGPPLTNTRETRRGEDVCEATWRTKTTAITVGYAGPTRLGVGILLVTYAPADRSEAGKL